LGSLVALLGGVPRGLTRSPPPSHLSPRLCRVTAYSGGAFPIHAFNAYAPADGTAAAAADCTSLVLAALAAAAELGQAPAFLVGDFNQDPLPAAASAALALSGWRGLGAHLGPTTSPGGGRAGRRVDYVFANASAAPLVETVLLRWDLGVATHAALAVRLRLAAPPAYLCRLRPLSLAAAAAADWGPVRVAESLAARWEPVSGSFRAALAAGDLDAAWPLLSRAAGGVLSDRMGASVPPRAGAPAAGVWREAFAPRAGRDGDALTLSLARELRVLRQAEQALRAWPCGPGAAPMVARRSLSAAVAGARGPGAARLGRLAPWRVGGPRGAV